MKIKLVSIAMILALTAGFNANAFHSDKSSECAESSHGKHGKKMHGHKMRFDMRSVVTEYMLAQGDITQGEVDLEKAEHKATREALKALKDSGDTEGFEAKKDEVEDNREERHEKVKAYIDSHEDLQAQIKEKKKEFREERKERREERKAKKAAMEAESSTES
ncbi:hypothetical protein ACPUVO_08610 [Pseudocolwellia sp. HL-MZ19]|uniref:hypothetical protein n=1 Tax=unclassified Pseudocolwellia TaxID=2848178 RepID=UPI003CF226D4